ncbi:phage tail protein [Listeria ilorinensis]|uniref:phage tail protein n=1 Tax=Listeria ilorinensis TaxID=2867439 RepID=UPI001EF4EC50|nr:phage tail protein [Listeria ilorinensis]
MITIGFKSATIGIFDAQKVNVTKEKFTIKGEQGKGATVEAKISGLSAEAKKIFGSNNPYFVSQKGTGDLKNEMSILDVPYNVQNAILGWVKDTDRGFTALGDQTQPPYAAVFMESEDGTGQPVALALFRGRWSREEISLKTLNEDAFEPESEALVMACVANDEGLSFGMAVGTEEVEKLRAYTFPTEELPDA